MNALMAPGQKTFTTVIQTLMQKSSVFDIYKRFYPSPVFVRQAGALTPRHSA